MHTHIHTHSFLFYTNKPRQTKDCTCFPCCFLSLSSSVFLLPFIVNFPLIGANFPALLFSGLTGGLSRLTKAARLCRNLPTLLNVCPPHLPFSTSHLNLLCTFTCHFAVVFLSCVFPPSKRTRSIFLSSLLFPLLCPPLFLVSLGLHSHLFVFALHLSTHPSHFL